MRESVFDAPISKWAAWGLGAPSPGRGLRQPPLDTPDTQRAETMLKCPEKAESLQKSLSRQRTVLICNQIVFH